MSTSPFKTKSSSANSAPADDKKILGYLNFYLPTKAGSSRKVGSIALMSNREEDSKINDFLNCETSDINAARLMANMTLIYNSNVKTADEGFDLDNLGFEAVVETKATRASKK